MPAKIDLTQFNCSLAQTLGTLVDFWAMLIVRDAFIGVTRFAQFQSSLDIARNILTKRLVMLVEEGILDRRGTPARPTYHLTSKGLDLIPALVALAQWGDQWLADGKPPMLFVGLDGAPVQQLRLQSGTGKPIDPSRLTVLAGPGADQRTRSQIKRLRPDHHPAAKA